MYSKNKLLILSIITLFALIAFILNTWYNWQMFKYNLNIVPTMQSNNVLGSEGFLIIMNIVSNLFNPIVCAGYVMAFYLLSHRRFEILVFLIWFIFLSVFLTFMKSLIQQARPYWMDIADVKMLQWTCYTEFGCPSGHSMLGLILIQFMIRYFTRAFQLNVITRIILVVFGVILQSMVVFSRVILGMHSLNQVLFGILLGFYSLPLYYMYMQKIILKICLKACSKSYRMQNIIINSIGIVVMIVLPLLITFIPEYSYKQYFQHISTFQRCQGAKIYQSFQYKCLQDASLAMAVFGIFYGLVFLRNQERLMKVIKFPRGSKKYIIRLILSGLLAVIPVAIFMNPLWKKLQLSDSSMAVMLFFLQSVGLMGGNFVLVGLAPYILEKLKLQDYFTHDEGKYHLCYCQINFINPINTTNSQISEKGLQSKQAFLDIFAKNDSINIPQYRQRNQQQ